MADTVAEPLGPDDPREIGQFNVIGVLGVGGMGEVYLGTNAHGYVAIKRVRPRLVSGDRFHREVGTMYRVPPGVAPRVLASDSTAARPWLATEYVPGVTVEEAVRINGPLLGDVLWLLLAETAALLQQVHEVGIVHRDLNPANVMLVRDGVKLIDFGIARAADQTRLTRSGASFGTHGFTAPDHDSEDPKVAQRADVYSLAALIVYAASGSTPGALLGIEQVRAVDAELATIVEPCLSADAKVRPTARALIESTQSHIYDVDSSWPPAVMQRIEARRAFALTPVGKMETIPPPEAKPEPEPLESTVDKLQSKGHRYMFVAPIAAAILLGGVATLVLAQPDLSRQHAAGALATPPTSETTTGKKTAHSLSISSTTPSGSVRPPATTTTGTHAPTPTATSGIAPPGGLKITTAPSLAPTQATTNASKLPAPNPSASSIPGIDGSGDTTQVPDSEADTSWVGSNATCSAWLDDNGSGGLAGVLNTSLGQSCGAELFRSDGMAYNFFASWGAEKTNFIPDVGSTMWICVWNQSEQSTTEVCASHFGMNGYTPVKK